MRKQNLVECELCCKIFNNAYRNSKWKKIGCNKCYKELRRLDNIKKNKKRRHELRKEHRCIICAKKVKPTITYHQYCPKHKPGAKK